MKADIHPTWYNDAQVTCSCGNTFTTGASQPTLSVDICAKCHPFFTGEMRFVDRQGRVDKFMQKMQAAEKLKAEKAAKNKAKKQVAAAPAEDPRSYQEILRDQQSRLKATKQAAKAA